MKRPFVFKAVVVLVLASFLLSVSPAYALEKHGTGYTVTDSRDYPIIFIPGMAGSTLDVAGGANAWPGGLSTNDEAFKVLALKDDGRTPLNGVQAVATGTVRYGAGDVYMIAGDWRFASIYQGFYDYMEAQGYKLNENPTGKVVFDFPYDFRQDNHRWTALLDKKVDAVLKQTKADKVILVGHSMGGLQARLYMKDARRAKKVAAVVFMGTPHHGAPMPFWAMTEGYNFGNKKLSDTRMWEISGNWEAGYQLLPDFPFLFLEAGTDVPLDPSKLRIPDLHDIQWINTEDWISTREAVQVVSSGKVTPSGINYGLPNANFAKASVDFHKELGDSVDKYPGVKYYGVRGTGQPTVTSFSVSLENDPRLPKPMLHLEKVISNLGDGTVSFEGGQVKGLDGEFEVNSDHGSIPSNADAQKILTDIRKQVNNEDSRNALAQKMTKFAQENIAKAKPVTQRPASNEDSMVSLAKELALMFMRGTPDPEKIKLRDEIKDMASKLVRTARVNITIASGAEKTESGAPKPEHLYVYVVNYEVIDSGTGVASGATMNVNVDSLTTFEQALSNTSSLAAAYQSGKITVQGTGGVINTLNAKIAKWISKYVKISL